MRQSALKYLVETFFDNSPEQLVEALLGKQRGRSRRRNSIASPR